MNPNRSADLAALILRVALGVLYLAHSLQKIFVFTLPGTAQFFVSLGLPGWLAYVTTFVELIGGIALLLGVQVRWVALVLLPFMVRALAQRLGIRLAARRLGISGVLGGDARRAVVARQWRVRDGRREGAAGGGCLRCGGACAPPPLAGAP
jgi:hypothetical protein